MIPKFRAYFEQYERMIEAIGIVNSNMILVDFNNVGNLESIFINNKIHVMQSTGLKDKNGVEIFEGDILKDKRGEIRFVYKVSGGFAINMFDSPRKIKDCFYESLADMQTQSWMQMSCEVVGNIFEDGDLIDG